MFDSLERELDLLVETVAPSFIDLDDLALLVAIDDAHDPSEGVCTIHDGCRPVY